MLTLRKLPNISNLKNSVTDFQIFHLVDLCFFDFPYHVDLDLWDEIPKFSKDDYLKFLNAFNNVNSGRTTLLFCWCFYTTISYLAAAIKEAKWSKQHKWTQINTFKQDVKRPLAYDCVTEEVTDYHFIYVVIRF